MSKVECLLLSCPTCNFSAFSLQVMDTHCAVEDCQDGSDMASTKDSHTEVRFEGYILSPEDSHTDSEMAITDSESILWDRGYLRQNHNTETTQTLERCTEPGGIRTERTTVQVDHTDMDSLGLLFDQCIQEVSRLQTRRDELIQELLQLQQPMVRAVEYLRGKQGEARRSLTLSQLDYIAVREEMQQVKRNLFATARDCIQSQVELAAQEYEVAQSAVTQEELQVCIQSLTQELSQLQEAHQNQLNTLRDQARRPRRPRAMSDVSHCRRASLSLQRRLSGSMKALEVWYEPRLMVLLKRRQNGEDALRKSRELVQDLKARLGPLREDIQRLELQRACLEERMVLREAERGESISQYKETVETLEETVRELKMEFQIQRKSKEYLELLKDGLLSELNFLRGCDESSASITEEEP